MRKVFILIALVFVCPALMAQATRTWVSGVGDDANPCSRTAPCKTWAGAISKTAEGGEIDALDPGGFGALTITKSITIEGNGVLASVLSQNATQGFLVNVTTNPATAKVVIRNLSINGTITPSVVGGPNVTRTTFGIRYLAGSQLTVENVDILGAGTGIEGNLATSGELIVRKTYMTMCDKGVRMTTSAGQFLGSFDDVSIMNSTGIGLEVTTTGTGTTRASIFRSNISHNNTDGVKASNAGTQVNIDSSQLTFNNGIAVNASVGGSTIRLSNNIINNNAVPFGVVGTVLSTGDNRVEGNGGGTPPVLGSYTTR
ncbi:MAG: hypothetical protein ACXVJT_10375 [Thermoanaerobaculia bacterium]